MADEATLRQWAGKTLAERCVLYHRRFSHKKLSPSALCRFYRAHRIKRKVIVKYKTPPTHKKEKYDQMLVEAKTALKMA